jgi:hypothetical protein
LTKSVSTLACLLATLAIPAAYAASTPTCKVKTPTLVGSYDGGCSGGFASGIGRAAGTDHYEGTFRDGVPDGFGNWSRADGARAEGEFVNGKLNGLAKIISPNGDVLDGRFADSKLTGVGSLTRKGATPVAVELRDDKVVPVHAQGGSGIATGSAGNSSPMTASLESTLRCNASPNAVETLKSLRAASYLGAAAVPVVDGIPSYKVTKPLTVFGFTALNVSGFDPRVPHARMPGTESPLLVTVVVDAGVPAVKAELAKRGITKASTSAAQDSTPGHPATEVTCFGSN